MIPNTFPSGARRQARLQSGFSLIELMVAMLLGFLVVAAAGAVFLSNKSVYASSETIGRIQENTRVAFELMSRDIREAGGNPCGSAQPPESMLDAAADPYWDRYAQGITGYLPATALPLTATGAGAGQRVAGTDAVEVHRALDSGTQVLSHDDPADPVQVANTAGFAVDDIVIICNVAQGFVFDVSGVAAGAGGTLQHAQGAGSINCSGNFREGGCGTGRNYCFVGGVEGVGAAQCNLVSESPAYVARVGSIQWYVGNNDRQGQSLYRAIVTNRGAGPAPNTVIQRDEIVEGVESLTITYLEQNDTNYTDAAGVTDWSRVVATRIELELTGARGALDGGEIEGVDGNVLSRTVAHVVALRNREGTL